MSFAEIALFAFGLAAVLVAGGVGADAATYRNRSVDWSNSYNSTVIPGPMVRSPEDLLFERSKGGFN